MRVAVIGGGAGGTYAAALLKRARPAWRVTVYERNPPNDTFGFGVVFSEPTLDRLHAEDEATCQALLARSQRWDPIEVRLRGATLKTGGQGFAALGRRVLLDLLREQARAAGVELRFGHEIDAEKLPEADVIIAADGARSAVRRRFEEAFEPTISVGRTRYIWFGSTGRFDSLTFLFEENEHGAWAVHAYPFDDRTSTFIVETDETSWKRAGLDSDKGGDPRRSLEYCTRVFERHLQGGELLSNHSQWARFRTIRTAKWHHDNVVLLGDAAHTVHFSMGSGTKLALEDALALSRALTSAGSVAEAAAAFEKERRPDVHRIQRAAEPSLAWWESFRSFLPFDPEVFTFHFLTRNLRVSRQSIAKRDPSLVEAAAARTFPAEPEPLRAEIALGPGLRLRGRTAVAAPFAQAKDAALAIAWSEEEAKAARAAGAPAVALVIRARDAGKAAALRESAGADAVLVHAPIDAIAGALRAARESCASSSAVVGAVLEPREAREEVVAALGAGRGLADVVALFTRERSSTADMHAAVLGPIARRGFGAPVIVPSRPDLAETMLLASRADVVLLTGE